MIATLKRSASLLALVATCLVVACSSTESRPVPVGSPAPGSTQAGSSSTSPVVFSTSGDKKFDAWRAAFAARAQKEGRSSTVIKEVLDNIEPKEAMVQAAAVEQAEFVKPIWDYVRSATTPARINRGQAKMVEVASVLDRLEADYAPPREIVAAIWGMETSYGGFMGVDDAITALADGAYRGRRVAFNEGELMAVIKLIENGWVTRDQFRKASWAGAVGQTQFMPSTFLAHGRDFDGDGRRDLWTNAADALASTANYLTASGWKDGQPWALEVVLPEGFDYAVADGTRRPVADWSTMGVTVPLGAAPAPTPTLSAELFLPAGARGPAFLLFDNFKAIKAYNNADSYALSVGLLADRLAGRPELATPWPTDVVLLTTAQTRQLQEGLTKLGYTPGVADGIAGRNTRKALQAFQKDRKLVADGFPTADMLAKVLAETGGSADPAPAP